MGFGKRNEIKIDPLQYNIGLLGEPGIGKTTIIYQLCEKLTGEDGYLFVECGREDGADAISGIRYINCPKWRMDYDELTNSIGFEELINDILENKQTEYPNLKTVVIDTYDQLREIAIPEIIRLYNKENPDKPRATSIKAVYGGYMAGDDKCDDMVLGKLWELKSVGIHFIIIGHVKFRDVVDASSGDAFSKLTTDMSMRSFNKIKTKLHFLGVASIDREIIKEKRNKKDVNVVKSETRKITFRDDNYAMDSKSRFAEIVDEIPFDVDALIKAFTDAIKAEAAKGNKSMDELKKEQEAAQKQIEERAADYGEKLKESRVDDFRNDELVKMMTTKFSEMSEEEKKPIKAFMKEKGFKNFKGLLEYPTSEVEEISKMFA